MGIISSIKRISPIKKALVAFLIYFTLLITILLSPPKWALLVVSILFLLIIAALILAPTLIGLFVLANLIVTSRAEKFLREVKIKKNTPAHCTIILGWSDGSHLKEWFRPNYYKNELVELFKCLDGEGKDYAVYTKPNRDDVEVIMTDERVREVFFLGHGESHGFALNSAHDLYYCEFSEPRYRKDYVHQLHCGTKQGRSLIEFVVPIENHDKCYIHRGDVYSGDILKYLRKRGNRSKVERSN